MNGKLRPAAKTLVAAVCLTIVTCTTVAFACSVPVFRYALEHWKPDAYVVYVFNKGDLSAEQLAVIETLRAPTSAETSAGTTTANLVVQIVDLDTNENPRTQKIWQDHLTDQLPLVVVQSPPKLGPPQTVWQGELNAENIAQVVESPLRAKIGKLLVDGQSVVWVLLECGNKEADDGAFATLSEALPELQKKLKLPEIEAEDLGDLSVDPDALKIAFSAVRLSRDNPEEQALVEMLLQVEPDLSSEEYRNTPMAFPIFGRGRALYALVGKGISAGLIEEASQFLTGACQCTVKAQNPGVDLVMNIDWDRYVKPIETLEEGLPPLAGFSGFGQSDDEPGFGEGNLTNTGTSGAPENGEEPGGKDVLNDAGQDDTQPTDGSAVAMLDQTDGSLTDGSLTNDTATNDTATNDTATNPANADGAISPPTANQTDLTGGSPVGMSVALSLGFLVLCVVVATYFLTQKQA
jgi:hypothetical protein